MNKSVAKISQVTADLKSKKQSRRIAGVNSVLTFINQDKNISMFLDYKFPRIAQYWLNPTLQMVKEDWKSGIIELQLLALRNCWDQMQLLRMISEGLFSESELVRKNSVLATVRLGQKIPKIQRKLFMLLNDTVQVIAAVLRVQPHIKIRSIPATTDECTLSILVGSPRNCSR